MNQEINNPYEKKSTEEQYQQARELFFFNPYADYDAEGRELTPEQEGGG